MKVGTLVLRLAVAALCLAHGTTAWCTGQESVLSSFTLNGGSLPGVRAIRIPIPGTRERRSD